jgi:multidrug efflux system membrane fusion protein
MTENTSRERARSRRNAVLAAALLLLIGLVAWHFAGSGGGAASGRGRRPAATVGVARAQFADMPVTVTEIGTVQPIVTATVRTQIAGVLFSLHFAEGQFVAKGQLIAQIDPRPYQLALNMAVANLARDQATLNLAVLELKRYQVLLAQDSIARQTVDLQVATVAQDQGTVAADQAAIGTAKLNLAYTSITAPVSGVIGLREADIGNYLTPSDTNGIAAITETSPIDVTFALPQAELPALQQRLAAGTPLPATARDQSGTETLAQGKFLTLDNLIDTTSGTVKAKARFTNQDGKLFPNQFVNLTLLTNSMTKAITVPVTAVRHGAKGDFVFLLQPHRKVKLQLVTTGPADLDKITILSGVAANAEVITEGADNLDDGSSVVLPGDAPKAAGQHRHGGGHQGGAGANS